jgi:hypothetical protein
MRVQVEDRLRLPASLQRDLVVLFAVKLGMLGVLYWLFFSPTHRHAIDVAAHIAGR